MTQRVLFVRHGKQVSSGDRHTALDEVDPLLAATGAEQAEALAARLVQDLYPKRAESVLLVSSPMRRALGTAAPTARALGCSVVVHGAMYEFACCGRDRPGTTATEVRATWTALGSSDERTLPDCSCAGFAIDRWDYRGSSAAETEAEARLRGTRIVQWLQDIVHAPEAAAVVVVVAHQTLLDLVMQLLLEPHRRGADWRYGGARHKFGHTGVAELRPGKTRRDEAWSLVHAADISHCSASYPCSAGGQKLVFYSPH